MLQAVRDSWVFQGNGLLGWQIIDFSFTKMKQLAHIAENVAENGIEPKFTIGTLSPSTSIGLALQNALESVEKSRELHLNLRNDPETKKHAGLIINLDLGIQQEDYEAQEIKDWLK
jgi:hypothetical protein